MCYPNVHPLFMYYGYSQKLDQRLSISDQIIYQFVTVSRTGFEPVTH